MPPSGLSAAAFESPSSVSANRLEQVPVQAVGEADRAVGEAVDDLQRERPAGEPSEHDASAVGAQIDGREGRLSVQDGSGRGG